MRKPSRAVAHQWQVNSLLAFYHSGVLASIGFLICSVESKRKLLSKSCLLTVDSVVWPVQAIETKLWPVQLVITNYLGREIVCSATCLYQAIISRIYWQDKEINSKKLLLGIRNLTIRAQPHFQITKADKRQEMPESPVFTVLLRRQDNPFSRWSNPYACIIVCRSQDEVCCGRE